MHQTRANFGKHKYEVGVFLKLCEHNRSLIDICGFYGKYFETLVKKNQCVLLKKVKRSMEVSFLSSISEVNTAPTFFIKYFIVLLEETSNMF